MGSPMAIPSFRRLTRLRRFGVAMLLAFSSIAAGTGAANAAPVDSPDVPSCAEASSGAPSISLAGAAFSPRLADGGLAWDARFVLDVDAAFDFRGGVLRFAVPLPAEETLVPAPGLAPLVADGHIVGLCVRGDALRDRTVAASFVQPIVPSAEDPIPVGAPVAAGSSVQIIETSIGERRIEPIAAASLERHVGYVAPRAISHGAREEARRLTDVRAHVSTSPIYVRGEDVHMIGGLTARIVDPRARAKGSAVGIGIAFAGLVGALVLAARKLRQTASVERADALLASEIDHAARATPAARTKEPC